MLDDLECSFFFLIVFVLFSGLCEALIHTGKLKEAIAIASVSSI
jgi:hypothetical protein